MFYSFTFAGCLNFVCFYAAYFIVSVLEDSIQIATFFYRVDLLTFAIIFLKISLEIVYSQTLVEG